MTRTRFSFQDEALRFRVESFLKSRHFPSFDNLDVDVHNGSVTVSGRLRSYYEKQVAMNSCQRVAGVVTLIDRIDVQKRINARIPDRLKAETVRSQSILANN